MEWKKANVNEPKPNEKVYSFANLITGANRCACTLAIGADYSPCTPLARTIKYKETCLLFNKLTNTIYISYTAMLLILIRDLAAEFP